MRRYWLFKSEPDTFSIDDLARSPNQTTPWDGVRNFQARNMLRDDMKPSDQGFFYHSSCAQPGIVGIVSITAAGYPDRSAQDPQSPYFDPKSRTDNPIWYSVDVKLIRKFDVPLTLTALRNAESLADLVILRKGNRLSITPVTPTQWSHILELTNSRR